MPDQRHGPLVGPGTSGQPPAQPDSPTPDQPPAATCDDGWQVVDSVTGAGQISIT